MTCKCCDCMTVGNWQIKGSGGGTSDTNVVIGNGTLNNLTETWTPLWYTSLGPTTYNLVVTCDKKEEIIDTWTSTIVLCSTEAVRYPEHTISLATTLPDPCKSCGLSFGGETIPVNEVGYTFTGSVDGEWSNQLNWKDVDGATPSGTLPGKTGPFDDDIVIKGNVLSCSLDTMPQVYDLTTDGGNIGISLAAVNATISGSSKVLLDGDCTTGGVLYVTDPAIFIESSENEGYVVGAATFKDSSRLRGKVSGNVELRDTSLMQNTALTHASCGGNVTAYDTATIVDSDIYGNLLLTLGSHTENTVSALGTVSLQDSAYIGAGTLSGFSGAAAFTGSSSNHFGGTVQGSATFDDISSNGGTVTGSATFSFEAANSGTFGTALFTEDSFNVGASASGSADFIDNAQNKSGGSVSSASFSGTASNAGDVVGAAAFTGSAVNTGTVGGLATFAGTASNSGPLTGSPTFAGQSTNTGTFTATATFNGDSINTGTITGNQVFNDNSQHKGSIIGNATFNGTSSQLGTVSGNVVCNTSGPCTTQP